MRQYPRPGFSAGHYSKDKGWGIAMIVSSVLGICIGAFTMGLGTLIGGAGAATASSGAGGAADAQIAFAGIGGMVALVGFAIAACSAVQIAGGVGVMQGRRWGFVLTAVLSAISLLLNVPNLPAGLVGVAVSGVFLYYCYVRLSGKEGPAPI